MNKPACFISIEGIEGVGKSTAVAFLKNYMAEQQIDLVTTREPGGTEIAEAIRKVFLGHYDEAMCADTELLLMFAGRMQNVSQLILPALKKGQWVLADRFVDASFAYQGGGRGVAAQRLETLAGWVSEHLRPDLTILLDAPVEVGMKRLHARGVKDRIEMEETEFFKRVRQAYLDRACHEPQRFCIIDASRDLPQVQQDLIAALQPWVGAV